MNPMLQKLHIRNYVLIPELELSFEEGLHAITGETGAGKSLLMGALGLIAGERADLKAMQQADKKCMIEAWFLVQDSELFNLLERLEIEADQHLIVRREILPGGKSRAFVNDSPVTLDVLKSVGSFLLDIHGQNDSLSLGAAETQLQILDLLSKASVQKEAYKKTYQEWRKAGKMLQELETEKKKALAESDYKQFVFEELREAQLRNGEQEELENQIKTLQNAERIKSELFRCTTALEGEGAAVETLRSVSNWMEKLGQFSGTYAEMGEKLRNLYFELKEISNQIQLKAEQISDDPKVLETMENRLSKIYTFQKKYHKSDISELINYQTELEEQLTRTYNIDEKIGQWEELYKRLKTETEQNGLMLREKRKAGAAEIKSQIEKLLQEMGIAHARFEVDIQPSTEPGPDGLDLIRYLFSANPGLPPADMKQVASGGEFSRLMLAFKYAVAKVKQMPTLIFDEIDTGISGEVAKKVGRKMKELAETHQVFSITHSPQMASQAHFHWLVYKTVENMDSRSAIRLLDEEGRIAELAGMIAGDSKSEATLKAARELLAG